MRRETSRAKRRRDSKKKKRLRDARQPKKQSRGMGGKYEKGGKLIEMKLLKENKMSFKTIRIKIWWCLAILAIS